MYLLDTNVLSELRKGKTCNQNVALWAKRERYSRCFVSALSFGELRKGIERIFHQDPEQAYRLDNWLIGLRAEYSSNILPVTQEIAERWGSLEAQQPRPIIDGLIAATALEQKLTLVTRNISDFQINGLRLVNPFEQE